MDIKTLLQDFNSQGYSELDHGITQDRFDNCIEKFREMIQSHPSSLLESTDYRYDPTQRLSLGFRDKSSDDGFDEKYYFHFHPDIIKQNYLADNIQYHAFLGAVSSLYDSMHIEIETLFQGLIDMGYISRDMLYGDDIYRLNTNLRILQYRPKDTCEYLAAPHVDRGIFTIALYETDPGLRFYDANDIPFAMPMHIGKCKIFPSSLWSQYISKVPRPPMKHDVIHMAGNKERASIVMFINPAFGKGPYNTQQVGVHESY